MILIALALATAPVHRLISEQRHQRLTHSEFVCDDHPYRSRGCGLSLSERRLARRAERRAALIRFFMREGAASRRAAEEIAGWRGARLRDQILATRLCGPEDVAEVGTTRGHPRCNRYGWNGHRYVSRRTRS